MRGCQRDEVRGLQPVVEVLRQWVPHGERGFLEAHAVLRGVARRLGLVPLEIAVHDRRHGCERTSPTGGWVESGRGGSRAALAKAQGVPGMLVTGNTSSSMAAGS